MQQYIPALKGEGHSPGTRVSCCAKAQIPLLNYLWSIKPARVAANGRVNETAQPPKLNICPDKNQIRSAYLALRAPEGTTTLQIEDSKGATRLPARITIGRVNLKITIRCACDVKSLPHSFTTGIYARSEFSLICRKCIVSTSNGSLPASARRDNGPVTSPTLVRRLQSWEDTTAWRLFADQYNHLFEKWSQSKLRNPADVDELNQQVLWEMARRITRFQYDPTKSFRGWLRTLHHSRLLDFLKVENRRLAHDKQAIQVRSQARRECLAPAPEEESLLETSEKETTGTFVRALTIQQRVQDRVSVQTWTIFSEIAINGQSIADTAKRHEMRYASAFAAYTRVCRMLRQEANA